jgi:hypothetical protein
MEDHQRIAALTEQVQQLLAERERAAQDMTLLKQKYRQRTDKAKEVSAGCIAGTHGRGADPGRSRRLRCGWCVWQLCFEQWRRCRCAVCWAPGAGAARWRRPPACWMWGWVGG